MNLIRFISFTPKVSVASLFKLVAQSCGLPLNEAIQFLEARPDTAKSWWFGRRTPPDSAVEKLLELSVQQDIAAQQLLLDLGLLDEQKKDRVTVIVYETDSLAQKAGWPSANAYRAVIRKVVEKMPFHLALRLVLVNSKEWKGT